MNARTKIALATALVSLAASAPALAQKTCSPADAKTAGSAIDRVVNWSSLHATWKQWGHCDSGETADLFTEALMRLAVAWKEAAQLAEAMKKEPEYKTFIVKHMKSEAAKADADDVYARARSNCPKGHDAWCKEITELFGKSPSAADDMKLAPMPTLPTAPSTPTAPAPQTPPKK